MGIFWVLLLYLIVVKLFTANQNKRLAEAIFGALGLFLVLALRSPYCGVDLVRSGASYYNVFLDVQNAPLSYLIGYSAPMERGWMLYCYLVSLFTNDFSVFVAITALIQIIPIAVVFYLYSKDITFSYLIYICLGLYVFSFSGLRQATAISITFLSFHVLQKEKKWLFVLLVLLASSFHNSAIVFLVVYFLRKRTLSLQTSIITIFLIVALLPFLRAIVKFLTSIMFPGKYAHYEDEGGAITMFVVYIGLFLLSFINKSRDTHISFYRWMILCCIGCQSLGVISSGAMTRIGFYFSVFFPLLLPEISVAFEKKDALIVKMVAGTALILFFFLTTKDGYLNVVPYYFLWEKPL